MSNIFKRFKGKQKSSEKDENVKTIEQPVVPREKEEFTKSTSLSPSTSESDVSPQDVISQGNLFSGMKLTKSSQVLEPVTSPYNPTSTPTDNQDNIQELSKFDFLTEDDSKTSDSSGFMFLNQTTPTPILEENDQIGSSGFAFITEPEIPPSVVQDDNNPTIDNDPINTREDTENDLMQESQRSNGFSFLMKEPRTDDTDPHSSTTEPHSNTTDSRSNTTEPRSCVITKDNGQIKSQKDGTHSISSSIDDSLTNTDSHASIPVSSAIPLPVSVQKVGRQAPPNKKKKKHRAVRPGQERNDEIYSGLMESSSVCTDLDGISIDTIESSTTSEQHSIGVDDLMEKSEGETQVVQDCSREDGSSKSNETALKEIDDATGGVSETLSNIMKVTGDTGVATGDTVVATGDTVVATGNTVVATGDTVVATGDTVVATGDTVVATCDTVVATGDTVVATGDTMVATDDDNTLLVQFDEENVRVTHVPITKASDHLTEASDDLTDVFSHMTQEDSNKQSTDNDTVNYTIELSPVEKMSTLLEGSENSAKRIRNDIDKTTQQFSTILERNGEIIKKITERRHHIKELKAKEAAALSEENYEQAEELRQELESINVFNDRDLLLDTQTKVNDWLKQCNGLMTSQMALHIEVKEKLTTLQEEQTQNLVCLEKEFSSGHAKEKIRLQTMRDELERERGHIALDREHLEKRQLLLQDEVSERAAEFIKCKRDLEEEEKETREEIEILEKKLCELKKKQSDLITKIQSEDEKIDSISEELSSEHTQLKQEQERVDKTEKELQEKVVSLNRLQLSYEASLELHNKNKESIQLVVSQTKERLTQSCDSQQLLEDAVSQSNNWTLEDIAKIMKPTELVQSLLDNEKLQEETVKEATTEVLSLQTNIASFCKKITDQETQLQKLQEAKKIAASARQYREAAKLSAEEKQLSSEISDGRQVVAEMENDLSEKNNTLLTHNHELDLKREEREKEEKETDIKCINELTTARTTIKTRSKSIEHSFLHTVLDHWSNFIMFIIKDLCIKHGLELSDYITNIQEEDEPNMNNDDIVDEEIREVGGVDNETHPHEERTPGVGMEVPEDSMVEKLRLKIEEIEEQITVCCNSEKFEQAADLNDELTSLKAKLTEQLLLC